MKKIKTKELKFIEESKGTLIGIVKRRNELGITQMDLAMKIGIGFNVCFIVETGKTKLDPVRLLYILSVLEITPAHFIRKYY